VGEIGKNLTLLEFDGQILLVDCGVRFPNEAEMPGIDLIIPDFTYLLENKDKVQGILLTHGHEDHIGSLPYLLRQLPLPIYGTRYTLGLVKAKLEEHRLLEATNLREIQPGERLTLGNFRLEFFSVCHSIVDGIGLAIDTPLGLVVHSGDFKFDESPVDGVKTDADTLRRLGDRGVLALLSDSTNVERLGHTPSEREVGPALDEIFRAAKRRIISTSFASNVHRFQTLLESAQRAGRKLATLGMSMTFNMRLATDLRRLRVPNGTWISFDNAMQLPPERTVIVTTGSQGEPMSGLARMAAGIHTDLKVQPGDVLVYSARAIPGNERTINTVVNNFYRRGAEVITESNARVHVSGHGSREDLKRLLELVRPRYFLPAHGEMRHQVTHRRVANETGLKDDNVFLLENGQRWAFDGREAWVHGRVQAGEVLVDGKGIGDISEVVLRDRKHLSEDGMVLCLLGLSEDKGEILAGPDIVSRGFVYVKDNDALMDEAKQLVREALANRQGPDTPGWAEVRAIVVQVLKKFFKQRTERRPMILPVVMEI
jgi:ribonuclease J